MTENGLMSFAMKTLMHLVIFTALFFFFFFTCFVRGAANLLFSVLLIVFVAHTELTEASRCGPIYMLHHIHFAILLGQCLLSVFAQF